MPVIKKGFCGNIILVEKMDGMIMIERFLVNYIVDDFYKRRKAEYSIYFILVMLAAVLVIIMTEMFLGENMTASFIKGGISCATFLLVLFLIYKGRYEIGINVLIALGFARLTMLYSFEFPLQFYLMTVVVVLSIHVIYIKKYQIHITNILALSFYILQWFRIQSLVEKGIHSERNFIEALLAIFLLLSILLLLRNITSIINREINERHTLIKLADKDPLTGICNRRKITEVFQEAVEEHQLSMYLFDIDDFKSINDTYGHDFGDYVLKELTLRVGEKIPAIGFARWGGEEFVLITDNKVNYSHQILEAISKDKYKNDLSITVSIGRTMIETHDSIRSAVVRADKAMYHSKNNGKNQSTDYEKIMDKN